MTDEADNGSESGSDSSKDSDALSKEVQGSKEVANSKEKSATSEGEGVEVSNPDVHVPSDVEEGTSNGDDSGDS